jgi:predicted dehydrogenase
MMANNILNWGLLSTARINEALIYPLHTAEAQFRSPRNRLSGVASRELDRAQAYAHKWGIPRAYGSYEAMLADPEIDVIYNPLPNSLHTEWTVKAAQAGKHVLCEKPLACTVEEVDAMADAAKTYGVVVAEAFMYRHHPQTLRVKELLEDGAIGKLLLVRGVFTFLLTRRPDIRLDPSLGGGSLWDVGCYPISYARTMIGEEPVEVFGWQNLSESGVDVTFVGQMRFPSGAVAQIASSFNTPFRARVELVGEAGSIRISNPFSPKLNEHITIDRGEQKEKLDIPGMPLYLGEVEDMAEAILNGRPPRISLSDSRANVAVIQTLLKSARLGQPITLDPKPDDEI